MEKEETNPHCSQDTDLMNCSVLLERFDKQDHKILIPDNKAGDSLSGMNLPDCSVSIEKLTDDSRFMEYIQLPVINSENVGPKITSIVAIRAVLMFQVLPCILQVKIVSCESYIILNNFLKIYITMHFIKYNIKFKIIVK